MSEVLKRYEAWIKEASLPDYLKMELQSIVGNYKEIEDRFYQKIQFGTGGMRGLLGAGTNRINIYTIRLVAEGLALHIQNHGEIAMQKGVVIAYDTRHFSEQFALEIAKTIGKYGIRVYLFEESRPTPELSFAVRQLGAFAGVVVTASHNPAEYNGFKVYGEDGGQLPPAASDQIVRFMDSIENIFSIDIQDENTMIKNGFLHYILKEIDDAYQECLLTLSEIELHSIKETLSIIYTPLHGSGLMPVTTGLKRFGFHNVTVVPEQADSDPDFPTVSYPNPEERQAFELAIQLGHKKEAELLLATDPDADRLGVAVRKDDGNYELLTGNQLGALLLNYILLQKNLKNEIPGNGIVLKTIVTSELGRAIAEKFGVHTQDTLTGFKFISEKIEEYNSSGQFKFLFGYEESYGYLIGEFSRDKDAVQAALVTSEMAAYYKSIGISLFDALTNLYNEFGYYKESLKSITLEGKDGQDSIGQIMSGLRNHPPDSIGGIRIIALEDYKKRTRHEIHGESIPISLPEADVLKFFLEDDSWVCIRPSGTEPKCKLYFGVRKGSAEEAEAALRMLEKDLMERIVL
ncbi:phospho-sugar mutase [Sporosarcina siberiensis]|uniref:Phosphoglucomutase n=1 Tax=Sporosarcina siberiensis TaxID=1365606 RepID=A0ABW4SDS6_9BACL